MTEKKLFTLVPVEEQPWTEEPGLTDHTRATGRVSRTGSRKPRAPMDLDRATREEKWARRG